ncbi:hypothetical protein [uncultured Massilia sp.]|uniref:hypothetical protein n=1 Tax=uncultured Massilia sp. TaxID=169973 RepID=UPI0025FC3310|nr:hypothetical protein [uncultured Massilia sp.]
MAVRDIAIACQGGGSHAAYTGRVLPVLLGELDNLRVAREADDDLRLPGADVPALVAVSGTSGGAISALLGWYGFITGGAGDAERRLDAFWSGNAALKWTEGQVNRACRAMADLAGAWGLDIKTSPYAFPMAWMELLNTSAWPLLANALGRDNPWMRPAFFDLPGLLRPGVDWQLVGLLGEFASIPLEVRRWMRSDLQAALYPPEAPCRQGHVDARAAIEGRIAARLDAAAALAARMDQIGLDDDALLRAAFARWRAPALRFEHAALAGLARAVQRVTRHIPHLLVGAVELHQGEFVAFSSERAPADGGISLDAVLASAAVPWLFRARELMALDDATLAPRQLVLWDGLFSQNPPIKNFLSGVLDESKKPDEIWVVQINPVEAKAEAPHAGGPGRRIALSGGEIWDLRNALAGNLALNQELGFVEAINRRMDEAADTAGGGARHGVRLNGDATPAAARGDRQVQVDRIIMDGSAVEAAAGVALGANSKLDRDPRLRAALYRHGRLQAQRYLGLRSRLAQLCGDLAGTLGCACGTSAGLGPDIAVPGAGAGSGAALVVEGATIYGIAPDRPESPQALVRWRSAGAEVAGRPVRIEGQTELAEVPDSGAGWRLKQARVTAVVPQAAPVPAQAARAAPAATASRPRGPRTQQPRRGERRAHP